MTPMDDVPDESEALIPARDTGVTPSGLHANDIALLRACRTGEGLIPLTAELMDELGKAMEEARALRAEPLSEMLSAERCAFVRHLRVERHLTWRSVAAECHRAWSVKVEWWWPEWNQLVGMDLCDIAARHFGEDYMKGPWN